MFLNEQKITHLVSKQLKQHPQLAHRTYRSPSGNCAAFSGRSSVFGWERQQVIPRAQFESLAFAPGKTLSVKRRAVAGPDFTAPSENRDSWSDTFILGRVRRRTRMQRLSESRILITNGFDKPRRSNLFRVRSSSMILFSVYGTHSSSSGAGAEAINDIETPPPALCCVGRGGLLNEPDHPAGYVALLTGYSNQTYLVMPTFAPW